MLKKRFKFKGVDSLGDALVAVERNVEIVSMESRKKSRKTNLGPKM